MRKMLKTTLLVLGSYVRRDVRPKAIFYHDVGVDYTSMGTAVDVFKKHLKVLEKERRGGEMPHVICFDDGFRGAWDCRELLPRGTKIFIAVGLVGLPKYLTWDEMRVLQKDYGVDFQCHTWSHQTLIGPWNDEVSRAERTEEWYRRELVESKVKIEQELSKVVDELCFPVGYFSDAVVERCKRAGYVKVYASYPGNLSDTYVQPRCLVQDLSPMGFTGVLRGGMNRLANRYYRNHYVEG